MSTDNDVARSLRSWMKENRHEDADRVLDVVFDQIPATPQRRAGWLAQRFFEMNSFARIGAVAAAAVAIVIIGIALATRNNDVGPAPSVSPSSNASLAPVSFTVLRTFPQSVTGVVAPPEGSDPEGIGMAVGPDGLLYVTDLRHSVTVIDPATGEPLRSWGRSGSGEGEFAADLLAVTVAPNGQVYVADPGNHRIQVFDPNGTFIREMGSLGTGEGQFQGLGRFVGVGEDGSAYAADWVGKTITKFDGNGAFVWRVGGPASADAELQGGVHSAAVMKDGTILVTFEGRGKAALLDPSDGSVIGLWSGGSFIGTSGEHTVAANGSVSVFQYLPAAVQLFDADGNFLGRLDRAEYDLYPAPVFTPDGRGWSFNQSQGLVELEIQ